MVCSSNASEDLIDNSYDKFSLNEVHAIDFYIDGADEFNDRKELIKGGGGALQEKRFLPILLIYLFVLLTNQST